MSLELTPENMQSVFDSNAGKAMLLFVYSAQDPESSKLLQSAEPLVPESSPYASLVRIDIDAHPEFQQMVVQWGVRSVPSVIVVQKGRISGLLQAEQATLENIKKVLDQVMPKTDEIEAGEARNALEKGDLKTALLKINEALAANDKPEYRLVKADLEPRNNNLNSAKKLLDGIPLENQDSYYQKLKSALDLAGKAAKSPDVEKLEEEYAKDPSDKGTAKKLAVKYNEAGEKVKALDLLFSILRKDLAFEDTKKLYLDILATMEGDPEVSAYRRKLYTLMY